MKGSKRARLGRKIMSSSRHANGDAAVDVLWEVWTDEDLEVRRSLSVILWEGPRPRTPPIGG